MRIGFAIVVCLGVLGCGGQVPGPEHGGAHGQDAHGQDVHRHDGHRRDGHGHDAHGHDAQGSRDPVVCRGEGSTTADAFAAMALSRIPEAHGSARHGARFEGAEACADRALQRSPGHPEGRYVKGLAQLDRHEFRQALASAHAILAHDPEHVGARVLASDARLELGDLTGAERELSAALSRKPTAAGLVRAAHLRLLHGDPVGAQDLYRHALLSAVRGGDRPTAVWAAVELSKVLREHGDQAGAEAGIAWARAHAPRLFDARFGTSHGR